MNDTLIKPLMENVGKYITNDEYLKNIYDAYVYAYNMHEGQYRKSGELYINHPIAVSMILSEYQTDPTTIISGLLHDVIEDTEATYESIYDIFGEDVANIVSGVTKLKQYKYEHQKSETQAKNHQKMLIAMSKDIRVIVVKLADRLNNMRTLSVMAIEKQKRISLETVEIYAPLAHRLGMYRLKVELEDLSFKYMDPNKYRQIAKLISDTKGKRENDLNIMQTNIEYLLSENGFRYQVSGRIKNIHSVHKKMMDRKKEFEDIFDLLALRIIVDSVADCYRAIGIIHAKWVPIPNRFKDYIAMPKPNLYQSLHTSVISQGKIYEIQIRTQEMDDIAEYGVAAHWAYKDNGSNSKMTDVVSSKLKWYGDLIKFTEENKSDEELLSLVKDDIFHSNVYVFTPNGDIIDLPAGSTPLDFAFRIHTQIGIKTVGAIVNGKIAPLDYHLVTGDVVEVKTSKNSVGPNDNWLKIVKTSNAKSKIKNFLNKQKRDILIEHGRQDYHRELQTRRKSIKLSDKLCGELFGSNRGVNSIDDLFYEIGKKTISPGNAINVLTGDEKISEEDLIKNINKVKTHNVHSDTNIVVEGIDNPSVRLANCCSPIPGDKIVGYISIGHGITVHRDICKNVSSLNDDRFIKVYWGNDKSKKFSVNIKMVTNNRDGILAEIINIITANKGKISHVSATTNRAFEDVMKFRLEVADTIVLDSIIINLQKIPDVYSIERLCK